jgi:hypothetical protein
MFKVLLCDAAKYITVVRILRRNLAFGLDLTRRAGIKNPPGWLRPASGVLGGGWGVAAARARLMICVYSVTNHLRIRDCKAL